MRKLTNLQMGVIVDKVYKELKKKIDVINKERLEKVNIDRELKEDTKLKLLREYYEYDRLSIEYEELMSVVKKAYAEETGISYYSTLPTEENYILKLKQDKANLIHLDKKDIEASVILSDVTDIETLIETISKNITKDIPELN